MPASQEKVINLSREIHLDASYTGPALLDVVAPSAAPSIHSIPVEIWIEVFSALYSTYKPLPLRVRSRSHPLLQSMLVCRHWNSIIASAPILWSFMYLDLRHDTLEQVTDLCDRYSSRLEASTAILDLTVSFVASPSRFLKKARVVDVERNWDIALSILSNALHSLVLMVPQSYRYHAIQCPHLERVRIVGTSHTSPCIVPGLGATSSKVHTLCLDGVSPSRLENISDWTGPVQHLIYTASWGGLADVESSITRFPQARSVHIILNEIHETVQGAGDSISEYLEGLAIHLGRDWYGRGLDRTFTHMRGIDTLQVLSIAWAYQSHSGLDFGSPAQSSTERSLGLQTFPFQSLRWFLKRCKDCRLSKFSLFIDANSAEMSGLRDLILQEPRLERVSELVLGAHADRIYDHYTMPWCTHVASGLLSKVVCHPAYLLIAVDAILSRYTARSCASRVRLEILDGFDFNDYGLRRLLLTGEEIDALYTMPDAESINADLLVAGERGLRVDCIYKEKIIQNWNTNTQ